MKKKEAKEEELQRVEEEVAKMQSKMQAKEREIERVRGPNYKSKGDLREYANALREKNTKYKNIKAQMTKLKDEKNILDRTLSIVQ